MTAGARRAAAIAAVLVALTLTGAASGTIPPPTEAVPVLVELFTAEGCSSCPPADKLLALMVATQPATGVEIIGLGEHVDYWDRLGWKDRFSSAAFTARQQAYADRFGAKEIYTPQLVVDGAEALVGSDVEAARGAIERARARPHGRIALRLNAAKADTVELSVEASGLPPIESGDRGEILAAVIEDDIQTDVKRGENRGRMLAHAAVVHSLSRIGDAANGAARSEIKIKSDWRRDKLAVVVFAQEQRSRRVLAATRATMPR